MSLMHFKIVSEGGKLNVQLKSDTLCETVCWSKSLLDELKVISENKNLSILSLELPTDSSEILEDISGLVGKIVLRKACECVIVSDFHLVQIRGKVHGLLLQDVKKTLGNAVTIETLGGSTLLARDVISFSKYTSKIVCSSITPEYDDLISKLNLLNDNSSLPTLVRVAVTKAYKKVRKARLLTSDKVYSRHKESKSNSKTFNSADTKANRLKSVNKSHENTFPENGTKEVNIKEETEALEPKSSSELPQKTDDKSFGKEGRWGYKGKRKVCYVCKNFYCHPKKSEKFLEYWRQYPKMCKTCADLNFQKRQQRADLTGKYAVVTGGRIKIGYELVLKLLRDGCFVIVTTRFPHNASKSFAQEKDFEDWQDRLKVYGLDLKDIAGIYRFVKYVQGAVPHLDILINNAAQTLRRPIDFYRHLLDYECIPQNHLADEQQPLLATSEVLNYNYYQQVQHAAVAGAIQGPSSNSKPVIEEITEAENGEQDNEMSSEIEAANVNVEIPDEVHTNSNEDHYEPPLKKNKSTANLGSTGSKISFLQRSFSLDCQPNINNGAENVPSGSGLTLHQPQRFGSGRSVMKQNKSSTDMFNMGQYFPRGAMDDDGQQLDLRRTNSWRTVLDHVPVPELMEVIVVNVIAPFILNRDLKPLQTKSPAKRKFIVNVSAMEGQFNRASKTKFHPHTNMAKAALNMMTRTAALGYEAQGIYMTSVDTGWVTDERPLHMARREKRKKGFRLPLDCIDGAARIYDPIVMGLTKPEKPHFAVFLKDYKPYPW